MTKKRISALVFAFVFAAAMCFALGACTQASTEAEVEGPSSESTQGVDVRVASLKGPTSIGLVAFMDDAKAGLVDTQNNFEFQVAGTADEVLPLLISGNVDIALIPANAASIVFNKTEGGIQVLNVNTLGVLYVVSADASISSIADLAGRTVYMTGKGTTPEYVVNTLLEKEGIADQVALEFKSEATELAAAITADPTAIAVLPEPYATAVTTQNADLKRNVSLTDAWRELMGSELVTGVTVVRTEFAKEHPEAVEEFLALQEASVNAVNADPAAAAQLVVDQGIVENPAIAEKAIPVCNLVFLSGAELREALDSYLSALFAQDPASIGGSLPTDDFYYLGSSAQ